MRKPMKYIYDRILMADGVLVRRVHVEIYSDLVPGMTEYIYHPLSKKELPDDAPIIAISTWSECPNVKKTILKHMHDYMIENEKNMKDKDPLAVVLYGEYGLGPEFDNRVKYFIDSLEKEEK